MDEILLTVDSPLPVAKVAVPVAEPETAYDRIAWSFSAASRVDGKMMDAVISMSWVPTRVLRDGTVEVGPESLRRHANVGTVLDERGQLTDVGQRLVEIIKMLVG